MDAVLETLLKGLHAACAGQPTEKLLVLGARPHADFRSWTEVTGWQPFKPWANAWDAAGFSRSDTPPAGHWPVVACLPGKSKEEILHHFALARERVSPGGIIVTALSNLTGAARFEKHWAEATGQTKSLSKHKCRAFWAQEGPRWDESCFSAWRDLGIPAEIPGTRYHTMPGIFSASRIDGGSQFLADHLPRDLRGTLADLGAGWGYLSDQVLSQAPKVERIDLFEADFRALACARQNLSPHGDRARFHWHDVTRRIEGTYDAIVMNPPFHTGQEQDTELGIAFLTAAAGALRRNGRLFVVANRQLPYESHLTSLGLRWRNAGETPQYKLLFATA